jgi:hypothetical protein
MNDYIVYTKTGDQPIELIPKTPLLVGVEKVKEKAASFSKKVADSVKSSFTFGRKAPRPSAPSFLLDRTRRSLRRSANESNTKDSWDNNSYRPAGGGKRRKTKRKNHKSKRLQKRGARNKTRKRH